jgi:hypothetical protein
MMPFDTLAQNRNWMVRRWQQDQNFYLEVFPMDKAKYAFSEDMAFITHNVRRYYPSSQLVREYWYPEYQQGSGDLPRLVYDLGTVFDQIRDAAVTADREREIR